MIKRFINNISFFVIIFISFIILLLFMIMGLAYSDNTPSPLAVYIVYPILFGGMSLFCIIWLLLSTEFITIYEDYITYRKFSKLVKVFYKDIIDIKTINKTGYGPTGVETVWNITDNKNNVIWIVKYKKRKKYIDFIQNKIAQKNKNL